MLSKLSYYGTRGITLRWFSSYLTDRKQYVYLNGVSSAVGDITHGVPQGSILGPLLFILFVNDITQVSKLLHFILFADDTNTLYSHPCLDTLIDTVNSELIALQTWFVSNKLSVNLKKTSYMLFGMKNKLLNGVTPIVKLNCQSIDRVVCTKFLGVDIDERLSWHIHISSICCKISRSIGILRKLQYKLSSQLLLTLYNVLIKPHLFYCNIVWGSTLDNSLNSLLILQKRALRLVANVPSTYHSSVLFKKYGVLKITDINKLLMLSFIYRSKFGPIPRELSQFFVHFKFIENSNIHNTRHGNCLISSACRINVRKFSIFCCGVDLWNSMPDCISQAVTLNNLKVTYINLTLDSY